MPQPPRSARAAFPAIALLTAFLLAAITPAPRAADDDRRSPVQAPGEETSSKKKALEAGAVLLQDKPPIEAINTYLDGFHFYSGNIESQMEAHHYCTIVNEEVTQCVIYDGNVRDAKIMGVEYIISERLFKGLPEHEKPLWHSHAYEVKSGQLLAPGIPQAAEHALMQTLVSTYGKTWHTWHTDQDKTLPLGIPQLMMGFTADGQADPKVVDERDRALGIDSRARRENRADIEAPPVAEGADAWQRGQAIQLRDPTGAHPHSSRSRQSTGSK